MGPSGVLCKVTKYLRLWQTISWRLTEYPYLKSGGPDMTITKYPFSEDDDKKASKPSKAECCWFDENNSLHIHVFPIEALELI